MIKKNRQTNKNINQRLKIATEEYLIEYKTYILSSSVSTAEEQANVDTGLGSRYDLNLEIY